MEHKQLSDEELKELASQGDEQAKAEILKRDERVEAWKQLKT